MSVRTVWRSFAGYQKNIFPTCSRYKALDLPFKDHSFQNYSTYQRNTFTTFFQKEIRQRSAILFRKFKNVWISSFSKSSPTQNKNLFSCRYRIINSSNFFPGGFYGFSVVGSASFGSLVYNDRFKSKGRPKLNW